jgi:hypothetical protein
MFQRQGMFLKRSVAVGNRRMTGVARLGCEAEISQVQAPQLLYRINPTVLRSTGMKRQ